MLYSNIQNLGIVSYNIIRYWELSIGMCQSSSAMDECDVSDGI